MEIVREDDEQAKQFSQTGGLYSRCNNDLNFGRAPFFVSTARHGEAQDMSGTRKQTKQNTKQLLY
jgi:hypothetical protein